jgi:uncharacterized protein DUF1579
MDRQPGGLVFLFDLAGRYAGTHDLILPPGEPSRSSLATATVAPVSRGKLVRLDYTWDDNGPQEGTLLVGAQDGRDGMLSAWTDSWHLGSKLMVCAGEIDTERLRVLGTYTAEGAGAPPGPDWGWRIIVELAQNGAFFLRMFNIAPDEMGRTDGAGDLAVHALFGPLNE